LLNVILHTPEEIGALLSRAEELARARPPAATDVGIALVLHGPEVEFFARPQYARYKTLVDRAQRLDAARIIEIKICQTEMKSRGLKAADIPEFIEPVPYGPDEIARLQRRGYIYL
jgi:intracellular sulfur oxidation DsrE/DsrF family protein